MKQQDVFKKVGTILKELNEQYEYLSEDPAQLNEIELELFAANANFLKDHTEILRKLAVKGAPKGADLPPAIIPQQVEKHAEPVFEIEPEANVEKAVPSEDIKEEKPATVHEEKFFEPVVQRINPDINIASAEEDEPEAVNETSDLFEPEGEPETIRHELILDDSDWEDEDEELYDGDDVVEEGDEQAGAEPDTIEVVAEEPEPVAEEEVEEEPEPAAVETEPINTFPAEEPAKPATVAVETQPINTQPAEQQVRTINQIISDQLAEKKTSTLQPISDLKSAINLNDKLLYIKDLFNGYSLAYSEAIEILNRFTSFEEAERFLTANYVNKNNWESKPTTTTKFYDLLKRRYA
ncbi:MAG: hypothetical protein ABIN95_02600 [Mucilaginibacter sp.]